MKERQSWDDCDASMRLQVPNLGDLGKGIGFFFHQMNHTENFCCLILEWSLRLVGSTIPLRCRINHLLGIGV